MTRRDSKPDGLDRNGHGSTVFRREILRTGAIGLGTTIGLAGISTSVAAEKGAIYDLFDDDESGRFDAFRAALAGAKDRFFDDEDKRTADDAATETTTIFNENSDVLVDYANDRIASSRSRTGLDTIRLRFAKDVTVERWIVVDVVDGEFVTATMVDERPGRPVDHWVKMTKLAAANAPDELEHFVDEFAKPNDPIDTHYENRLKGRYGPDVKTSLMD